MIDRIYKYRTKFLEEWFEFNTSAMFFIECLIYGVLLFVKRSFIIDAIAAFEILNERGELWVFDIIYNIQYLSIPVFLIWKLTWITLALWIGCFAFGYRLHFNKLWKLTLLMEIVFFVPEILKIAWFSVFVTEVDYNHYISFYPLSLINLVDYRVVNSNWHYILKSLNVFEVIYSVLLIVGIYFLSGKSFKTSSLIVVLTYCLFFLIWLLFYGLVI